MVVGNGGGKRDGAFRRHYAAGERPVGPTRISKMKNSGSAEAEPTKFHLAFPGRS